MGLTASAEFGETENNRNDVLLTWYHFPTRSCCCKFDSAEFIKFCNKASSYYYPKYCTFNNLAIMLFQVGEVWCIHDLLVEAMELLAKYHVITICKQKESLVCTRSNMDKTTHEYSHGQLKLGCSFHFKLSSLETEQYMTQNSTIHK